MIKSELEKLVEDTALKLGEQFDAVQILVSRQLPQSGGTSMIAKGCGNWFARQGMAHSFIQCDIADDSASKIAEKLNPPDTGDNWKTS